MINNVNNKLNKYNVYKSNINNTSNILQNNGGSNLLDQLKKMDQSQNEEIINFLKKINQQINKAEMIAIKFIHGENISKDEQEFIYKNFPDIKEIIEETIKEENKLKKEIILCKTNIMMQKIIKDNINKIQNLSKENIYSKTHVKIKMASIENLRVFINDLEKENKFIEVIFKNILKGNEIPFNEKILVNKKYIKIKPFIEQNINEINNFKKLLKKINNKQNKQILLSQYINKIEKLSIKEINKNISESKDEYYFEEIFDNKELNKLYEKIKYLSIDELKNEFNKDADNIENFYMSIYTNMKGLISKTNNIFIIVIIMIFIIWTIL